LSRYGKRGLWLADLNSQWDKLEGLNPNKSSAAALKALYLAGLIDNISTALMGELTINERAVLANQVVGIDIPVTDLNGAVRFCSVVLGSESHGGKVQPEHPIGHFASRGLVLDSEGNRMALHSM
jgi:hypothetical protein